MKNSIIIFTVLLYLKCFPQVNSGEIIYNIKVNPISFFQDSSNTNSQARESIKKINRIIPTLKFSLIFNCEISEFRLKKQMAVDNNEFHTKMAILVTQGNKIIFSDIKNRLLIEQTSFLDEDYLIKSSMDNFKWEFTKEKKYIDKYLCYKAISFKEIEVKNKNTRFNYVAWYCPEIKFNYGPINIFGLPGMVLEFTNDKFIYFADEIKFSKNQISIEFPTEGILVTKEEFADLGKRAAENTNH